MAYQLAFTAVQQPSLSNILFTDVSVGGVDANIYDRQIQLIKVDNTALVPSGSSMTYIDWPIVNSSGIGDMITVNVLPKDYSLLIIVNSFSSSPISGATYISKQVYTFNGYTNSFAYSMQLKISANELILNDTNFEDSLAKLYNEIDNSNQCQVYFNQQSAQAALDRAYQLITHQTLYF